MPKDMTLSADSYTAELNSALNSKSQGAAASRPGTSAQQKVYAAIADAIKKGRYRTGSRISIRSTAAAMGTSITPVREALLKFEALGAVVADDAGSLHIPTRDYTEVLQIYAAREIVEGQAAAEAAPTIMSSVIADLRRLEEDAKSQFAAKNFREIVALNEEFHFTIYRASENALLLDLIDLLWLRCGPMLPMVYGFNKAVRSHIDSVDEPHPGHARIIAAIEARDPETARSAVARDIHSGLTAYKALTVDLEAAIAEMSAPGLGEVSLNVAPPPRSARVRKS